jgi:hypothetical protein
VGKAEVGCGKCGRGCTVSPIGGQARLVVFTKRITRYELGHGNYGELGGGRHEINGPG